MTGRTRGGGGLEGGVVSINVFYITRRRLVVPDFSCGWLISRGLTRVNDGPNLEVLKTGASFVSKLMGIVSFFSSIIVFRLFFS